jgi:hypothetical protein
MKAQKSTPPIDVMIIIASVLMLVIISLSFTNNSGGGYSIGINGVTETRCINGFRFVITSQGYATQITGQDGKPVPCSGNGGRPRADLCSSRRNRTADAPRSKR